MRVPLKWLQEYVDIDVPAEKLRDLLNLSGTKVETVTRPGANIRGIVVGEVKAIEPHPNADNLLLVEVNDGSEEQRVVCGAHNFAVGDRVPFATVGARLPGMEITERKIRGQVSKGMLCSGAELGISKDHSGILVLPNDSELGADVTKILGLDDAIFELEITPNRADCMGVIGVAREVAALVGSELKMPDLVTPSGRKSPIEVDIKDKNGCPRYTARFVNQLAALPSPAWMAQRLIACGVRPISNIVDITNYVMLETGQPLHAFDATKVEHGRIVVRRAKAGEPLLFLDGVERMLDSQDLVIADSQQALALAGVMGGERSEVSPQTTAVILESAHFDPVSIAYTTRRHGLRTEASARFERGTDPEGTLYAIDRAALLMGDLCKASISFDAVDVHPKPMPRTRLRLRPERTNRVLGTRLTPEVQVGHLRSVELAVTRVDEGLQVEVPTFRRDITREVDLIEEVARLVGYETFPSTIPPGEAGGLTRSQRADRAIRNILVANGVTEAWTSSFGSAADLDLLGLPSEHPARSMVALANPIGDEDSSLRTTLLPGLLRSLQRNVAQRASGIALFEIARVYEPSNDELPWEAGVLAAVAGGDRVAESWIGPPRVWDFYALKAVVASVRVALALPELGFSAVGGMPFHPTRGAAISLGATALGAVGELHPNVCRAWDVPERTIALEIALGPLYEALPHKAIVEELPKFPAALIDLAVVVDEGIEGARVVEIIAKAGLPELSGLRLFDVYRGAQVPTGKKSLAYSLELRSAEGTMTDEQTVKVRDRIVNALAERLGAQLRA